MKFQFQVFSKITLGKQNIFVLTLCPSKAPSTSPCFLPACCRSYSCPCPTVTDTAARLAHIPPSWLLSLPLQHKQPAGRQGLPEACPGDCDKLCQFHTHLVLGQPRMSRGIKSQ